LAPAALTKVCGRCKVEKRLDDFYQNATKPDHHNDICKECQLKVNKANKGD
jgi:hypothetical protein